MPSVTERQDRITFDLKKQGERLIFSADPQPDAPFLEGEMHLAPGADGPTPHRHPLQHESFEVLEGALKVTVEGKVSTIGAGESFTILPGQTHSFSNGSASDEVKVRFRVEPPLHFQWFLSEMARSAIRAGGAWKDLPFLEVAYMLHQMRGEYELGGIPPLLQRQAFAILAWVAKRRGLTGYIAPKSTTGT
jgi:quercetin dioxygenase-like cupin family protein